MGRKKGGKVSEEQKRKVSAALKGRKRPPEIGEKVRKALLGRGEGRSSWKAQEWRKQVLERDGHKCVFCGSLGPKLHCHHLVPWKKSVKLRFCVENGQTLCASCHVKEGLKNKELSEKGRFKKGHQISEELKRIVSEANRGRPTWNKGIKGLKCPWNEGRIPWNKGKPMSDDTKKKMIETKKKRLQENLNGWRNRK